jgi:hypothetical protein
VIVNGHHGYAVVPVTFAFKQKGVGMHENSQMTYALKKGAGGWKITAWTWVGAKATPDK